MRRLRFWVGHALPRTHWTTYREDGVRRFAVWRQWGTRCYRVVDIPVGQS